MQYFEVEFCNNDPSAAKCICIKGVRQPSVEEAAELLEAEIDSFGLPVHAVYPIEECDVRDCYDTSKEDLWPVFVPKPMTVNEYQKLASRTLNFDLDKRHILIEGVMGLCGEAGEAIEIVKKHIAQGHVLNQEHLVRELGDVAWYLAETATALGIDLETVFQKNIEKLESRFPNGFSSKDSVNRSAADI